MSDYSTIEETLDKCGSFIATPVGRSMLPLLRCNKDTVLLERLSGRPEKYDMVLYKRNNGKYVLHRLMEIREKDYVMCGDYHFIKEYGLTDANLIGICKGIYRGEKYIDCKNRLYLLYVRFWCMSLTLRRVLLFPMYFTCRVKSYLARRFKTNRSTGT